MQVQSSRIPSADQLLAIWQDTLGVSDASLDENFFDAGGSSLLAARLAGRIKTQYGCPVSAADVLSHPSVRQLHRRLVGTGPALDREASRQRAALRRGAFAARPARQS